MCSLIARREGASCADIVRLGGAHAAARGRLRARLAPVVRGLAGIAAGTQVVRRGRGAGRQVAGRQVAGGDEARAFAVAFARSYLSVPQPAGVGRFFADGLRDRASVFVSPHGPGVVVTQATVAREVSLGSSRALFTVAAFTSDGQTVYLTVPVAVDARGGLVVDDLPSFGAPPRRGTAPALAPAPLTSAAAEPIASLVRRFLSVYLDGEPEGALASMLAPGARVAPMGAGLRLVVVDELGEEPGADGRRVVVATVRVRCSPARAIYTQRYRLTVVHLDRWYVAAVEGGPGA